MRVSLGIAIERNRLECREWSIGIEIGAEVENVVGAQAELRQLQCVGTAVNAFPDLIWAHSWKGHLQSSLLKKKRALTATTSAIVQAM